MPEITVIVPVYRAEAYLRSCVDSILNQSYPDFQLILVEDGSPDGCWDICQEYQRRDSRVTALHQPNQGQAAARNLGLTQAQGRWLCFVDSDDLIHPDTLRLLYQAAQEADAGIAMCQMLESPELPPDFFRPRAGRFETLTMDDETLARLYDQGAYPAWVACGKLIRRELVESYLFCPGRVYEDNEAVCRWVVGAGKLALTQEKLYFYRTNPSSTTKAPFSLKKLDFLWALESITQFYGSVGYLQTRQRFFDRMVEESAGFYQVLQARGENQRGKTLRRDLHRFLRQNRQKLSRAQRERLLDAFHPRLIRLYWPVAGAVDTLGREGLRGAVRKVKKRFGKEKET